MIREAGKQHACIYTYLEDRQMDKPTGSYLSISNVSARGSKEHLGNSKEDRVWGRGVVEIATVMRGLPAMGKLGPPQCAPGTWQVSVPNSL